MTKLNEMVEKYEYRVKHPQGIYGPSNKDIPGVSIFDIKAHWLAGYCAALESSEVRGMEEALNYYCGVKDNYPGDKAALRALARRPTASTTLT